jgi:hypothetical protein
MTPALRLALAAFLLSGCVESAPQYSLAGGETGVFRSANPGRAIPVSQITGMDERQIAATFGPPKLDRRDAATRVLRYSSDGCVLFIYVNGTQAQYADAYDPQMRPIPADQCAGSVAAQKRSA